MGRVIISPTAPQRSARNEEELIERRNLCGIPDPTPYEAVKNIVDQARHSPRKRSDKWKYHRK